MDNKIIANIFSAWQDVVEKKKLDPVGKADADIDNDGDVDKSDEYLHNRRKEIKKSMKEEDDDVDIKMDTKGMNKCSECGGSSQNHDEECSKYKGESCGNDHKTKKESVRHEEFGFGEIISESENGADVLFDHGVEFDVPAEQLESIRRAMDVAKKSDGAMTPAVKKINKMKKGLADNPRVQKALKKANEEDELDEAQIRTRARVRNDQEKLAKARAAKKTNEEDELEEKLEKERVKHPNGQRPKGPGWVLKKSGEQSGNPHSEWERKTKTVESVQEGTVAEFEEEVVQTYSSFVAGTRAALAQMWEASIPKQKPAAASHDDIGDNIKGKGAEDMVKDADGDKAKVALDDEEGHQDAVKAARAVKKQAPARGDEPRKGDLKPEIPTDTTKSSGNPKIVGSQGE